MVLDMFFSKSLHTDIRICRDLLHLFSSLVTHLAEKVSQREAVDLALSHDHYPFRPDHNGTFPLMSYPLFKYLFIFTNSFSYLQRLVLDNKAAVEAFADDPLTPNAAEIYYTSYKGALFRTGTYIALTIVADIFIVSYTIHQIILRQTMC